MQTTLLSRVADGDLGALDACLRQHDRLVRAIARRYLRIEAEIDDLAQEVFVDLWRSAARYDGRVTESSFVAMITRRRAIDSLRRARRRPVTEMLDDASVASAGSDRVEARSEAALAARRLGQLRPVQRKVFMLATAGGMSHREIASELDLPLGTVKTHARRAAAKLRRARA